MIALPVAFLAASLGFFAAFTIGAELVQFARGPFRLLYWALGAGFVGAFAGWRAAGALQAVLAEGLADRPRLAPASHIRARTSVMRIAALAIIAGAGLGAFILTQSFWPLHAGLIGAGFACLFRSPSQPLAPDRADPEVETQVQDWVQLALFGAVCVGLYLCLSWPDADDAFYVNLPIGMKAAAHGVMAEDTMLSAGAPLLMSTYRAESLPALTALVSALTGAPAILASHAILPVWLALLFAVTCYAIYRPLFGRDWLFAATLTLAAFFIFGGSLPSYGAHGLTRLYHGKAALLMIMVPLIVALAFCAVKLKSRAAIGFLAVAMVAAVGFTANAIYVAPLAAGLVVAAFFFDPKWTGRGWALAALAAAAHPVIVAGYFILFDPPTADSDTTRTTIASAVWSIFPDKAHLAAAVGLLALGLAAPRALANGRRAGFYGLAALAFILNPYLWDLYAEKVTGNLNYRLFWAIPFPFAAAVAGTIIATTGRAGASAVIVAAVAGLLAPQSMLSPQSGTRYGVSLLKIDEEAHAAAARAAALARPQRLTLAAAPVAAALPMSEAYAQPVYTRRDYLNVMSGRWDAAQIGPRAALADWVNGAGADLADDRLAQQLDLMCVGVIIIDELNPAAEAQSAALARLGAVPGERSGPYRFFVREPDAANCAPRQ